MYWTLCFDTAIRKSRSASSISRSRRLWSNGVRFQLGLPGCFRARRPWWLPIFLSARQRPLPPGLLLVGPVCTKSPRAVQYRHQYRLIDYQSLDFVAAGKSGQERGQIVRQRIAEIAAFLDDDGGQAEPRDRLADARRSPASSPTGRRTDRPRRRRARAPRPVRPARRPRSGGCRRRALRGRLSSPDFRGSGRLRL